MALSKAEMETFESLTGCRNNKEVRNTQTFSAEQWTKKQLLLLVS